MAVPRPPIQVMRSGTGFKVCEADHPQHDVTLQLQSYAQSVIADMGGELSGFVFKSRSPSCGIDDTPWFDVEGAQQISAGPGIFAAMLMEQFPLLPVIDEQKLAQPQQCRGFIRQVRDYALTLPGG